VGGAEKSGPAKKGEEGEEKQKGSTKGSEGPNRRCRESSLRLTASLCIPDTHLARLLPGQGLMSLER